MTFARSRGASELMVPAEVVVMEKMPVLGTGKVDHLTVSKLARERAAAVAAKPAVVA